MKRWFGSEYTNCPNCDLPDEDSRHLLHCTDAGRYALYRSEVDKVVSWLQQHHTDPELAGVISAYLYGRGNTTLCSLPRLSPEIHAFAFSQDLIGWENFMLGMISQQIRRVQYTHLLTTSSMLTVDDWMKQLIGQLLHIVHGQWIYRNISKYHDKIGSIRKADRRLLLLEIDRLMHLDKSEVPEESQFLLEVDFARLRTGDLTSQHYWVESIKAALAARSRKTFLQRRRAASSGRRPAPAEPPIPFGRDDDITQTLGGDLKRRHSGAGSIQDKTNKRQKKPD